MLLIPASEAFAQSHDRSIWSTSGHATVTVHNGLSLVSGVMAGKDKAVVDGSLLRPVIRHMDNAGRLLPGPRPGSTAIAIVDLP